MAERNARKRTAPARLREGKFSIESMPFSRNVRSNACVRSPDDLESNAIEALEN